MLFILITVWVRKLIFFNRKWQQINFNVRFSASVHICVCVAFNTWKMFYKSLSTRYFINEALLKHISKQGLSVSSNSHEKIKCWHIFCVHFIVILLILLLIKLEISIICNEEILIILIEFTKIIALCMRYEFNIWYEYLNLKRC